MFIKKREKQIKNLNVLFQEYEHDCGTKHFHFACKDMENSFLISFPTLPKTNDGRAHILEHLALCGSEKYNTNDPFFAMTRRSLASFMNAMTYPEKTVYPFSTSDKKDYFNLMSVYLDATFFPKLDYYNFLQEGWRYEFNEQNELEYSGIVYNEMKGLLSDKYVNIYQYIQKELKPGTIYGNESGGDPADIPNLKYEELKQFHEEFYHPSRATIMTYGDISVIEIQEFFEKEVISKIKTKFERIQPEKSKLNKNILSHCATYNFPASKEDMDNEYMLLINWLLGFGEDSITEDYVIFSNILLCEGGKISNELDNAGFGRPSVFNGIYEGFESSFHLGFEGLKSNEIDKATKYLENVLLDIAKNGVDKKSIEASLDNIELSIKDLNANKIPYGLKILIECIEFASNEKDPLFSIDFEEKLKKARKRFEDKNYVKKLANDLLHNIPKVFIEFKPQDNFFEIKNQQEKEKLKLIQNNLTESEKEKIKLDSINLKQKQTKKHNYDCLPQIKSKNVSEKVKKDLKIKSLNDYGSVNYFKSPANGISNIYFLFNGNEFQENEWSKLKLLTNILTGMPSNDKKWKSATKYRNILAQNYDIELSAINEINNPDSGKVFVEFSISHLDRKNKNIIKLMNEFLFNISFSSIPRIKQLVKQEIAEFEQNLAQLGNNIASNNVNKEFSFIGRFEKQTISVEYLNYIKQVYADLNKKETSKKFIQDITKLYEKLVKSEVMVFGSGSSKVEKLLLNMQETLKLNLNKKGFFNTKKLEIKPNFIKEAFKHNTEVNYCHQGFQAKDVKFQEDKSIYLDLAAKLITHNYLHPIIREQNGAYGAGAIFNPLNNVFSFYSYRDPNFYKTYNTFDNIYDWFINHDFSEKQLEEAKLSLLQSIEKPLTPKNEVEKNIIYKLTGITEKERLERKKFILKAKLKDVVKTFKESLDKTKSVKSAFISNTIQDNFDFEIKNIK